MSIRVHLINILPQCQKQRWFYGGVYLKTNRALRPKRTKCTKFPEKVATYTKQIYAIGKSRNMRILVGCGRWRLTCELMPEELTLASEWISAGVALITLLCCVCLHVSSLIGRVGERSLANIAHERSFLCVYTNVVFKEPLSWKDLRAVRTKICGNVSLHMR